MVTGPYCLVRRRRVNFPTPTPLQRSVHAALRFVCARFRGKFTRRRRRATTTDSQPDMEYVLQGSASSTSGARPAGSVSSSPPSRMGISQLPWTCSRCTRENRAGAAACDACGTLRPALPASEDEALAMAATRLDHTAPSDAAASRESTGADARWLRSRANVCDTPTDGDSDDDEALKELEAEFDKAFEAEKQLAEKRKLGGGSGRSMSSSPARRSPSKSSHRSRSITLRPRSRTRMASRPTSSA